MLPVFKGVTPKRKVPLFWRTHVSAAESRIALRVGDFKIVSNDVMTEFLLFNIPKDHNEEYDLKEEMPEKFEELKALLKKTWEDIAKEGPNEWWEAEKTKPAKGATLSY